MNRGGVIAAVVANPSARNPVRKHEEALNPHPQYAMRSGTTTEETAARVYAPSDAGQYTRHTFVGAKTATFDILALLLPDTEYHVTNRAASGDLTLDGTLVLNPPKGGTLVLEPGDTVTVRIVSPTEADVIGQTALA